MRASVARNGTFLALNGDIVVQKGYFWLLGNNHISVYYPIVKYQNIEVYS